MGGHNHVQARRATTGVPCAPATECTTSMSALSLEENSKTATKTNKERIQHWVIFAAAVMMLLIQGTGTFYFDAQQYWQGAYGIVNGTAPSEGFFELRGALAAAIFTPAALMARVFGEWSAAFFVLLQNSIVIAWLGIHVMPTMIPRHGHSTTRAKIVSAFFVTLIASGFAPYPLVDIYAALFCVLAAALLMKRRPQYLALAGLCMGISVNIRPAYLIAAGLILVATTPWNTWKTSYFALGVAAAQIPQIVVNLIKFDTFRPTPTATDSLIRLQASYASYVVRYDTLLGSSSPQQFYCSPGMAVRVAGQEPLTTGQLALTFVQNIPESLLFALQKISAALHWPVKTPYNIPDPGLDFTFAIIVTTLTVVGICTIIRSTFGMRRTWRDQRQHANILLLAMALATILTLVTSATENRFAVLLVLVGTIGCVQLLEELLDSPSRRFARFCVVAGIAVAAVVTLGYWGLSNPVAPGAATAILCSAT